MTLALQHWFADRDAGQFVQRMADIERLGKDSHDYQNEYKISYLSNP